jgi:HEAT repeat protein
MSFGEQTDREKRRDTILYGLEADVVDLIHNLQSEKNYTFNDDLVSLFGKSRSTAIREAVIGFFSEQKNEGLKAACLAIIADPYEQPKSTVNAAIDYAKKLRITDAAPSLRKILENDNNDFRAQAISALGSTGGAEDAAWLVSYLDGDISGDEKTRLIIRQNVMTALGELKATETAPRFMEIVKDSDENAVIRATAAKAIGQMKQQDAIPSLISLFEESDPILRAAAVSALSNYDDATAKDAVIEALKDSYYKVRLEALDASDRGKNPAAIPFILYRAKNDPEESVRMRSVDVLASFNSADGNAWLLETFKNDKTGDPVKIRIASALLEKNAQLIFSDYESILLLAVKDDKKKGLRYGLGKLVTDKNVQGSEKIADAFLSSNDTQTKAMGLDMYARLRYASLDSVVETISKDEKQGALQRRAKKILDEK